MDEMKIMVIQSYNGWGSLWKDVSLFLQHHFISHPNCKDHLLLSGEASLTGWFRNESK